jgi:RHS repeat-associated protein
MLLPKRHGAVDSYRYGFQGQEKDDEIKGEGNSVNYKFRMHDPRLGRFFAPDPIESIYSWNSPYAFSNNRVIDSRELEGLENSYSVSLLNDGNIVITVVADITIYDETKVKPQRHDFSVVMGEIQNQIEFSYFGRDQARRITYITNVNLHDPFKKSPSFIAEQIIEPTTENFSLVYTDEIDYTMDGHFTASSVQHAKSLGLLASNPVGLALPTDTDSQKGTLQVLAGRALGGETRTGAHEYGHGVSLMHPDEPGSNPVENPINSPNNLLRQSKYTSGTEITIRQMEKIITQITIDTNRYIILPGDTIGGVANRFNTTTDELVRINENISNPDEIKALDEIKIKDETK